MCIVRRPLALAALLLFVVPSLARAQPCDIAPGAFPEGQATLGSEGFPTLALEGLPQVGLPFPKLRVERGLPGATGLIVVGQIGAPTPLPRLGAELVPAAPLRTLPFTLDDQGAARVPLSALAHVLPVQCGGEFVVQAAVEDPGAQGGYAVSHALRARIGKPASGALTDTQVFELPLTFAVPADLDDNGRDDLVSIDATGLLSSFLAGREDSYAPGPVIQLAADPFALDVADLDGDGVQELVVGHTSSAVSIVTSDGGEAFEAHVVETGLSTHGFPSTQDLQLADLDLDGDVDLVAIDFEGFAVLLNHGDGSFAPPVVTHVGTAPTTALEAVAIADFDQDGVPDLALSRHCKSGCEPPGSPVAGFLQTWLGDGQGGFAMSAELWLGATSKAFRPVDLAVGDLDGDGALDVMAAVIRTHSVGTFPYALALLNQGDGTFVQSAFESIGAYTSFQHVTLADLDADGALDAVFSQTTGGQVTVTPGLGDGTFADEFELPSSLAGSRHAIRDFDQDGLLDLLTTVPSYGQLGVALQRADGSFGGIPQLPGFDLLAARVLEDFDGDGRLDMLRNELLDAGANEWALRFWRGTPAGTFEPGATVPTAGPLSGGLVADVDGDGLLDAILERNHGAVLDVFLNEGDGAFSFAAEHVPPQDALGLRAGDLDADGLDDVVVSLTSIYSPAPRLLVLRSLGDGTFAEGMNVVLPQKVEDFRIHDFTGDGLLDVLATRTHNDSLVLLAGDGAGGLTQVPAPPLPDARSKYLYVADLDRDGLDDLVATLIDLTPSTSAPKAAASLAVWKRLGPGEFAPPQFLFEPYALPSPVIVDIDADGFLDLAASVSWGALRIFRGRGDLSFEPPEAYGALGGSGRPTAVDADGDGVAELLFDHSGAVLPNDLFD